MCGHFLTVPYGDRAITHGISKYVGSIEVGKLADLVLWKPEHFGAKPEMVLKGGVIAWAKVRSYIFPVRYSQSLWTDASPPPPPFPLSLSSPPEHTPQVGEANGSIPTVQPSYGRPMWGSLAPTASHTSIAFVSQASLTCTIPSYNLAKCVKPVVGCRGVTKRDMKWNDALPKMEVDPEKYEVRADGVLADIEPTGFAPLGREYNLF